MMNLNPREMNSNLRKINPNLLVMIVLKSRRLNKIIWKQVNYVIKIVIYRQWLGYSI